MPQKLGGDLSPGLY